MRCIICDKHIWPWQNKVTKNKSSPAVIDVANLGIMKESIIYIIECHTRCKSDLFISL